MIGSAITGALLSKGHKVIILTRAFPTHMDLRNRVEYALWDIEQGSMDKWAIEKSEFIIHLAGAGVADKRWTEKRKNEILESRVKSGQLLAEMLIKVPNKVKAVMAASAIGWYGPDPVIPNPLPFIESDPSHDSFLGNTCKEWEMSIKPIKENGRRLVIFRTGIVLSRTGGALQEFIKPFHFNVATVFGNGKQVISWIHIDDLVGLYIRGIEDENMNGIYNAVSPDPVSNKDFMIILGQAMKKKPVLLHVPTLILKIALGEMSVEVLKSSTVDSGKVSKAGFAFRYPALKSALEDLCT